jgi:maleamate amidohydrolase
MPPDAAPPTGFGGALGPPTRPALLLVDFAMAYFAPDSPLYAGVEAVAEATIPLLAAARNAGLPILHTRVDYANPTDGGLFRRKIPALDCFITGSPLAEPHPALAPAPGEPVISKHYPSAFFRTPLDESLKALKVDGLIIVGLTTSGCIRATAVDALCYGFAPQIVAECVGDRTTAVHEANLFDLCAKTADVVGVAGKIASIVSEYCPT